MATFLIILAALPLLLFLLLSKFRSPNPKNLPPGPRGLPIIGNLHQLDNSDLPRNLWQLSKRYGPLMSLRLGFIPTIIVSSSKMAKEVLKTHDLIFCSRPVLLGQKKLSYNNLDVALSPYNDYWKEMRKICTLHLFSSKRVLSFRPVREEEVFSMIEKISRIASSTKVVNLSETLMTLTSTIICRVAFGKRYEDEGSEKRRFYDLLFECQAVLANFYFADHFPLMGWADGISGMNARLEKNFKDMDCFYQELIDEHLKPERKSYVGGGEDIIDILLQLKEEGSSSIDLTFDHIKAVLMNVFLGGTDTSASTVVWAMTLLMKNPEKLNKMQEEVRKIMGKKGRVEEVDLPKLIYLKAVIKEAMRLQPPVPLLIPRETMEQCTLEGYEIPKKTLVYVNAWAIGRDPECWENAEEFLPERFEHSVDDYKELGFEMIPFGAGRRGCPGMALGITTVELAISNLLYSFEWELPAGMKKEDIDTLAAPGITVHKKNDLCLLAKVYDYGGC